MTSWRNSLNQGEAAALAAEQEFVDRLPYEIGRIEDAIRSNPALVRQFSAEPIFRALDHLVETAEAVLGASQQEAAA